MMSPTQKFSVSFFSAAQFLLLCISRGSDKVHVQEVICTSQIAILPHSKNYSLKASPTSRVNAFVSTCKSECVHRFSSSIDIM